jgi:ABC-type glutathione transport system ATPase component
MADQSTAERAGAPLLQVRGVTVEYGRGPSRRRALDNADLSVRAGERVGVIGETGSGKSTLARAVLGLVPTSAGQVIFDGLDLTAARPRQRRELRRRGELQYVFQDPLKSLDPDLSVAEAVAEPLRVGGQTARGEIAALVAEGLHRVNLAADLRGRFPGELSGGQRQRVAIARALITDPRMLILDEPVSALDSANRVRVLRLLSGSLFAGLGMIFISHDLGSVAGLTDRVAVLYRGQIVESGPTAEIVNQPTHPYTRLLVGSAPKLSSGGADRETRAALRQRLAELHRPA